MASTDILGLDIMSIIFTALYIAFIGALLIGFFVFYDKNPYVPRKYYPVRIRNKDRVVIRDCKAWIITLNKVKWLRIGLSGLPSFKGIEMDIAILETVDAKGVLDIIEDVPGKYEAENYSPMYVPITQSDLFISEVVSIINQESRPAFESKLKEVIAKNSRVVDLNTSHATKQYIAQARREAERVKGDDFIVKYGPVISLIVACLFAYLIIDGSVKSYQTTMAQQASVMENGYKQVIQQCGGIYTPTIAPKNETPAPANTGVKIPFI